MEREQSNRIKEFRLFSGLGVEKLCAVLNVSPKSWVAFESGGKVPLAVWLKIVKYIMTQRMFFTSSTMASSEAADVVDMLDANSVKIKENALTLINSDNEELRTAALAILDNVNNIQANLPRLYK